MGSVRHPLERRFSTSMLNEAGMPTRAIVPTIAQIAIARQVVPAWPQVIQVGALQRQRAQALFG